jgi:hypothetical protein
MQFTPTLSYLACVGVPFSGSFHHLSGFHKRFDQIIFARGPVPALPFSGVVFGQLLAVAPASCLS